ncbi:hypothetical protein [Brevibacterium otitidis]|uniref:Uncharacterized protein n=1 Tax=Brevibacterium otitidis TaxID=53364 RepID=A0ABV5X5A5_9MICO|nr:hypothetical protein GCM10023233_27440 [Brevibacterium otitidis]
MTLRLDFTPISVVVVCDGCDWRTITADRLTAWQAAADHEAEVHPESMQARDRLRVYRWRHTPAETPPGR